MPSRSVSGPSATPVSYVMPVLNEADYIEAALASIVAQDHPGEFEIVLALGPSIDGTDALAERIAAGDPRIRIVRNPGTDIPIGLNLAIRDSRHPVIVRVDAHSELGEGYTERAIATLRRTGAASLGGVMSATGRTGVQAAAARTTGERMRGRVRRSRPTSASCERMRCEPWAATTRPCAGARTGS